MFNSDLLLVLSSPRFLSSPWPLPSPPIARRQPSTRLHPRHQPQWLFEQPASAKDDEWSQNSQHLVDPLKARRHSTTRQSIVANGTQRMAMSAFRQWEARCSIFSFVVSPNAALPNGTNKALPPSTALVEWPGLLSNLPLLHVVVRRPAALAYNSRRPPITHALASRAHGSLSPKSHSGVHSNLQLLPTS